MRYVVISENLTPPWDDGIKMFARSVGRALAQDHQVRVINVDWGDSGRRSETIRRVPGTRSFLTPALRREIRSFGPDAVLYVPSSSSSIGSFARACSLRRHAPKAVHGMVALVHRRHPPVLKTLLRITAPDVLFVPSRRSLLRASDWPVKSEMIPVGVDTTVFRPPKPDERRFLRNQYGISPGSFVCLHVGRIDARLNLSGLIELAGQPGASVVVVARSIRSGHENARAVLDGAGVDVVDQRVPVEEYYRMADCYVYPVDDCGDRAELPLSVFEALACGLPVVSTPLGGLRDFLPGGEDLRYVESVPELAGAVALLRERAAPAVRVMDEFSWDRVAGRIVDTLGREAK